jgi:virulence-associated protein VagC
MARRPLKERNIRKLTRTGGGKSVAVTLPIEHIRELKWREKQKVTVRKVGKKLIIEDWKK